MFLSFSASLATKFISLNNYPCITKPTFIDLNPDKHNQDLIHYIFMVNVCSEEKRRCKFKCFHYGKKKK